MGIVSVQAAAGNKVRPEYDCQERYQIILKFESGVLGHVALDASSARLAHGSDLIIDGENGVTVFVKDAFDKAVLEKYKNY